jgi:NAD(P)-dependent dehydrogenase (short-subunit alcohol dehydrogenase family)
MYGASKAGMEHLVMTWAQEVEATPLRVNIVDPDIVATKMRAAAMPGEDPTTLPQPADVAPGIAALCLPSETRHGARVLIGG